jgi:hypothetical protein
MKLAIEIAVMIPVLICVAKGGLHYADVNFRWFVERNGF